MARVLQRQRWYRHRRQHRTITAIAISVTTSAGTVIANETATATFTISDYANSGPLFIQKFSSYSPKRARARFEPPSSTLLDS